MYHWWIVSARFGRYELLRPLGRGGMAEVFLARYVGPEGFEKRLVIKRVLPQLSDDRRLLRMFFEEARTQVSLSHGNLVSVFDFGRVGNEYFIAMEHVEGADLATVVGAGRGLPPALVAHVGVELCRALAYVHRRGFVHRDLTPRNVLISRDGEVKLSDFGVALAVASEADPGLRGTLSYMAPEQARGERVDGRADLFALGFVLGEALEGRRLRKTSTDEEALAVAKAGAPVRLDGAAAAGPLGAILARATETAPEARFASADELLAALEAAAAAMGGGRERSVRELAALVPDASAPPAPSPTPPSDGATAAATMNLRVDRATEGATADSIADAASAVETYFRDKRSPTFVEEVLGVVTPSGSAPRRRAALGATVALLAAAAVGGLVVRRATSVAPVVVVAPSSQSPPAPSPPALAPSVPPPSPPPVAPTAARPEPAPPPSRRRVSLRRLAPVENGQLVIQCTPWCVPSIDGQARGKDGRNFPLVVPLGAHVVEVRRLDDRQRREIKVTPGDPQVLKFTFE
jgi:eukaryotic-like serine/threonine-protein kinase